METIFGVPVINILWTVVAGRRFQMEDPGSENHELAQQVVFLGSYNLQ